MLRSVSFHPPLVNQPSSFSGTKEAPLSTNQNFYASLHVQGKQDNIIGEMQRFVETIEKIKEKIQQELSVENVMEYKKTVKAFLNFYVDHVIQYKDVMSRHPKYGYAQKMTVVKQIETDMNDLEDIMGLINTKTGHLEMLNKIGEIHGMILNLVL
ncbi:MAG: YaaR family protein [Ectobacillus sp.]